MRIRSRLLTRIAATLAVALLRLLFRTCRVETHAAVPGISAYHPTGDRRYLYCVWHDQILMTVFTGRPWKMAGLVSRHQDGSYLADSMQMLGIRPVRGSTKRGGVRAMRELIDVTREFHVCITPDGPRGPRRTLKSGIVFLSSHTGRQIVPVAFACRRRWTIRGNWTDMMIPKPFTKIVALGSEPIAVPSGLQRDGIEHYTAVLQAEMDRLGDLAERLAHGHQPVPEEFKAAA